MSSANRIVWLIPIASLGLLYFIAAGAALTDDDTFPILRWLGGSFALLQGFVLAWCAAAAWRRVTRAIIFVAIASFALYAVSSLVDFLSVTHAAGWEVARGDLPLTVAVWLWFVAAIWCLWRLYRIAPANISFNRTAAGGPSASP